MTTIFTWVYLVLTAWHSPELAIRIPHIPANPACTEHPILVGRGDTAIGIADALHVKHRAFLDWLHRAGYKKARALRRMRPGYAIVMCTRDEPGGKALVDVEVLPHPLRLASMDPWTGWLAPVHTFKVIPGMTLRQALHAIDPGAHTIAAVERYTRRYWNMHSADTPDARLVIGWRDPPGGSHAQLVYVEREYHGRRQYLECFTDADGHPLLADRRGRILRLLHYPAPLRHARISSGWGWRTQPVLGYREFHKGIDYAAPRGTPVHAVMSGVVELAQWHGNYGRLIEIRGRDGIVTRYGHLMKFASDVHAGRHVHGGQIVGYVGNTGLSTGPHLYFEVWDHGRRIDPLPRTLLVRTHPRLAVRRRILASMHRPPNA